MEKRTTAHKMSGGDERMQVRYGHPAMKRSERAKIFMPFDALPEYRSLLKQKEEEIADEQRRGLGPQ